MTQWQRNMCPDCTLVWEHNLDGAWRYIAMIAIPVPIERVCPLCSSNLSIKWVKPLPTFPQEAK
jgi:hypothetical protein